MARTRSIEATRDERAGLEERIIAAISSVGPRNVAQISRLARVHQETVRYKIKKRFVDKGLRFQANVDYSKLGLSLYWSRFSLPASLFGSATKLFRSLNEFAYLVHFSKILPQGYFVALFAIPEGRAGEFSEFLGFLQRDGIVAEYTFERVLAQRHKTMDPSFFDFRKGKWDVDWKRVKESRGSPLKVERGGVEMSADYLDMLVIKELQKDARQHIVEIARKLKVNPKTMEYHYRTHVAGESLIPSYRIRWMKDADEALSQTTLTVRLTFGGLARGEYKTAQAVVSKIPYLWVEDLLEPETYVATLAVPLGDFLQTMRYISEELGALGGGVDLGYLSVEDSFNYTIPFHMFVDGKWQVDVGKMHSAVSKGLLTGIQR